VDKNGRCIVGDLGISTSSPVSAISRVGTFINIPPEIFSG